MSNSGFINLTSSSSSSNSLLDSNHYQHLQQTQDILGMDYQQKLQNSVENNDVKKETKLNKLLLQQRNGNGKSNKNTLMYHNSYSATENAATPTSQQSGFQNCPEGGTVNFDQISETGIFFFIFLTFFIFCL